MASLFRVRRAAPEEGGSGGKILRDRRGGREVRPSPYARPPPLSLPAPPPPAGSPGWLLGLVSGAGKLILSVFRSDGSSPDSFASSSSSSTNYSPRSGELIFLPFSPYEGTAIAATNSLSLSYLVCSIGRRFRKEILVHYFSVLFSLVQSCISIPYTLNYSCPDSNTV